MSIAGEEGPQNPYAAPRAAKAEAPELPEGRVPARLIERAVSPRPWLFGFAVIAALAAGTSVLFGGMIALGSAVTDSPMEGEIAAGATLGFLLLLLALAAAACSFVCIRTAQSLGRLSDERSWDSLADALGRQSSAWRTIALGAAASAVLAIVALILIFIIGSRFAD